MRRPLALWLLWSAGIRLLGPVGCSSLQVDVERAQGTPNLPDWLVLRNQLDDAGGERVHWSGWQPWICMCNLQKQARIRHLGAWAADLPLPLKASPGAREFWEEKPCSLQECVMCRPEECPDSAERSGWVPPFDSFPLVNPHDSEIPLPPSLDTESYDSLPVVDDMGEE